MNSAIMDPPFLESRRAWGPLLLRLFTGFVLVYGTVDNVLSQERMLEFAGFLEQNDFPAPLYSAWLSAYAQFLCGFLILAGLATRYAAATMVFNFLVAIVMVHMGLSFSANISVLAMLFLNVHLVLYGGGILALDRRFGRAILHHPRLPEYAAR